MTWFAAATEAKQQRLLDDLELKRARSTHKLSFCRTKYIPCPSCSHYNDIDASTNTTLCSTFREAHGFGEVERHIQGLTVVVQRVKNIAGAPGLLPKGKFRQFLSARVLATCNHLGELDCDLKHPYEQDMDRQDPFDA